MEQQFPQYTTAPWAASTAAPPSQQPPQQSHHPPQQPAFYVPPQPHAQAGPGPSHSGSAPMDPFGTSPFLTGVAGSMLRQQGESYLQRGRSIVSKFGFLSGGLVHYHFNITPEYVAKKLLMLLAPFLGGWSYARSPEPIAGGHKYLPPRQDVNAPDLYIPTMALWTYCILIGWGLFLSASFRPEIIYNTVSTALLFWGAHTVVLRTLLASLGIASASAPWVELACYAGYIFVPGCVGLAASLSGSAMLYHCVWTYGSLSSAVFLVRSMKRIIFQEARQYDTHRRRHNYLLLALALLQFPCVAWLARLPRSLR